MRAVTHWLRASRGMCSDHPLRSIHPRVIYENLNEHFDYSSRQRTLSTIPARPVLTSTSPATQEQDAAWSPEQRPVHRVSFEDGTTGTFEAPPGRTRLKLLSEQVCAAAHPTQC